MKHKAETAKTKKTIKPSREPIEKAVKTIAKNSTKGTNPKNSPSEIELVPASVNIRSYQVGFGDCFLLTFYYPKAAKIEDQTRNMLVDFGSTGLPPGTPPNQMMLVAQDIKLQCRGKLHVVVATHRHKDHISGFATQRDGTGTGDIIARLNPEAVIQPWTEDPDEHDPATMHETVKEEVTNVARDPQAMQGMHISSLSSMNAVSEAMLVEVQQLSDERNFKQPLGAVIAEQIRFLADDNALPNVSAVNNLREMGKNYFVHHGAKLDFSKLLPGIKISVLGPPTIEQHAEIQKERSSDKDEFWMLRSAAKKFWNQQAATGEMVKRFTSGEDKLFPEADVFRKTTPAHNRWFIRQIRAMRGEQMLGLVRILDKAMNNTSVIFLLDVGGKKLLFPGDAQIENWEYALSIDEDVKQLKDIKLYKVGHHGSRNATPKTLWDNFEHKGENSNDQNRLKTVVSTMEGKHGSRANHTEVPRQTLIDALNTSSEFHTTQTAAKAGQLFKDIEITFP